MPADTPKRRITLDGFNLALEKGTGVATYGRNLAHVLKAQGYPVNLLYGAAVRPDHDPLLKEVMFFDGPPALHPVLMAARMARGLFTFNRHSAFEIPVSGAVVTAGLQGRLPPHDTLWNVNRLFDRAQVKWEAFRSIQTVSLPSSTDVMHWTYPVPVRARGVPNIVTLHDLVPLRLPYTTLDRKVSYHALMKWIARTADHIVTVSEASRRDIIQLLGVPEHRVTNTYQAVHVPPSLRELDDAGVAAQVGSLFGLNARDYLLFFGSIEPKKNIGRLIEAYVSSGVSMPLVIVGARAWKSGAELKLLQSLPGASQGVMRIEYLPFPLLVGLIRAARAVVFPSLYEGFGLPVLEAMSLGTPVLTANTSSLPEVAGDAALMVDPYDVRAIAAALRRLERDDDLCDELSRRGTVQAAQFSQDAYAQRLRAMYAAIGVA